MKKIKLTNKCKTRLKVINSDEDLYDNYHDLSNEDKLIVDAGMYEDGVYVDNEFDDLDVWCLDTAKCEFENGDLMLVKNKITQMLELGLIEIN